VKNLQVFNQADMTIENVDGMNLFITTDSAAISCLFINGGTSELHLWSLPMLAKFMHKHKVYANVLTLTGEFVGYLDQVAIHILQNIRNQEGFWDVGEMNVHRDRRTEDLSQEAINWCMNQDEELYSILMSLKTVDAR
jgi:hypothetical protein